MRQMAYVCAVLESDRSQVNEGIRIIQARLAKPFVFEGTEHRAIQKAQTGIGLLCASTTHRLI